MRTKPSPLSPNASPGMTATCSAASSFSQNSAACHAGLPDAREDVERALRLKAAQAHPVEPVHQQAAAHVVGIAHLLDVAVAVFERLNGRRTGSSWAQRNDRELVHLSSGDHGAGPTA